MEGSTFDNRGPFETPDLYAKSSLFARIPDSTIPQLPTTSPIETAWPGVGAQHTSRFEFPALEQHDWLKDAPPPAPVGDVRPPSEASGDDGDVWSFASEDLRTSHAAPARSWEQFSDPAFKDESVYLSEAGALAFDAALTSFQKDRQPSRALRPDILVKSLFQLGRGRDSTLFTFKPDGSFTSLVADLRMSGLSLQVTRSILGNVGKCGQLFRSLKGQVARTYARQRCPPAAIAVAQTTSLVLLELDLHLSSHYPPKSVLRLDASFKLPFLVLSLLDDILKGLERAGIDQEVLTYLYKCAQEVERSEPYFLPLMKCMLARASSPWLDALSSCIGLKEMTTEAEGLRYSLDELLEFGDELEEAAEDKVFPAFFSSQDRALVRQIYESFTIIKTQQLELRVSRLLKYSDLLRWRFSWKELLTTQSGNENLQPDALSGTKADVSPGMMLSLLQGSEDQITKALQDSYITFEKNDTHSDVTLDDSVSKVMRAILSNESEGVDSTSAPLLEVVAASSFQSTLAARAKFVNQLCLRKIFQRNTSDQTAPPEGLAFHLEVLRRLLLMGDGMFVTRLSHALFDPSLASAERSKGRVRSGKMGLRLGNREAWPPATSELQLVLMGILTATLEEGTPRSLLRRGAELPGDISFAVRQLSEEEIERCMDPHSLEALDFLRIQYKPPAPLDSVITQACLEKYDAILKLLIRMTRLMFVVDHSLRTDREALDTEKTSSRSASLRLAHMAHHFVSGFTDYMLNTAIGANWKLFTQAVADLEEAVGKPDREVAEHRGVAYARQLHEKTLDDMLFACLLRKRHETVRALFEDVLRIILRFAAMRDPDQARVAGLYAQLRKQIKTFIAVCKGLASRREYGAGTETGLAALVARLTVNDFYSEAAERVLRQ